MQLSHEQIPSSFHGSPSDAVQIHLDVQSRNSIGECWPGCFALPTSADTPRPPPGIHFGTFIGAENESLEAVIELHEASEAAGVLGLNEPGLPHRGRMGVIDIGETVAIEIEDMMLV